MSVLEIETAIESLSPAEMLEIGEWLDVQRGMIAAAEGIFQMLDEEEGKEAAGELQQGEGRIGTAIERMVVSPQFRDIRSL